MKDHGFAAALALGVFLCSVSAAASATQFSVTGSVNFGNGGESLPSGVTFGNSTYDGNSGYLSSGKFIFPQATASNQTDLGEIVVTYQLSQNNTSVALVDSSGNAVMTTANIKLHIVSITMSGVPVAIGNQCDFEPVVWDALSGTATASGMDLTQATFSVPPAAAGSCGDQTSWVNDALAGNDNSLALHLTGDFTPPALSDLIFLDGFELHETGL